MSSTGTTWRNHFPDGRTIYYEGDDPAGFAAQIKTEFGFDPGETPAYAWDGHEYRGWDDEHGYAFHYPAEHLDAIYSSRFPMGS